MLMKPWLWTFIVEVSWETKLQAILPGCRALCEYNSFSGKMFLNKEIVGDTGEASACLLRSSEDRALSQYDSFSWKMVLKRPCIGDSNEDYICTVQVLGRQSF